MGDYAAAQYDGQAARGNPRGFSRYQSQLVFLRAPDTEDDDLALIKDGESVSTENDDVPGSTRGRPIFGVDGADEARMVRTDEFGHILVRNPENEDLTRQLLEAIGSLTIEVQKLREGAS